VRVDERDCASGQEASAVTCVRCGTVVLVRKSSPAQTSVQWRGESWATCTELAEKRAAGQHPAQVPTCRALRTSIDDAVRDGKVPTGE
jgi:hypothetical protein